MKRLFNLSKRNLYIVLGGLILLSAFLIFLWPGEIFNDYCTASSVPYNISESWSCGDGLACSSGDCGQRVEIYYSSADLNFSAPRAGAYSCTVNIAETEYGYHDHDHAAPQQEEFADISINGVNFGRTPDYGCNANSCAYGCACRDCGSYTTSFTQTVNLNSSNTLRVYGHQSHGLAYASVSCVELNPPQPPVCSDGWPATRPWF